MDTSLDEKLRVSMNITFPNVPCARLHLDIQVTGPAATSCMINQCCRSHLASHDSTSTKRWHTGAPRQHCCNAQSLLSCTTHSDHQLAHQPVSHGSHHSACDWAISLHTAHRRSVVDLVPAGSSPTRMPWRSPHLSCRSTPQQRHMLNIRAAMLQEKLRLLKS